MKDPFDNPDVQHLNLYLYLIPVLGFFPAIWTLYRRQASRQQLQASRLSVTLALVWLLSYILLETGAKSSELLSLPLLIGSSVIGSSYFIVCLTLMFRLWKRQPLWLPWLSQMSDRLP
jgi:hypothetical protein